MKKSDKLKKNRFAKLQSQKRIIDLAKSEKRELTPEENSELSVVDEEVSALEVKIAEAVTQEEREIRIAAAHGETVVDPEQREMDGLAKRFSFLNAARSIAGGVALTGVEKELNDEAILEARALNLTFNTTERAFSIPAKMVRATTQSVTQDGGEFGGALVTQENRLVEGFIPRLFIEDAGATFLSGLVGNVALPMFSDYEYNWLSELEEITVKSEKIGGPVLKPKRAGAGVSISNQLMLQSSVDVENMIYNKLRQAAARALNKAALNGDGVKEPLGILNMTGIQVAKAVAEQGISYEAIVELWGLIAGANADTGNETFVLNSKLAAALMTAKKDAGSGRFVMENGLIDGQKTIVTNLVEELAGLQTLIYGNFSELYVGQWGGVNFVADPYTGAGSGQVKIFSNLYADVQAANPKAFAANKFLKS